MTVANEIITADSQQEISLKDIIEFVKEFYKRIILVALCGTSLAFLGAILLGSYTASITLNNYDGPDGYKGLDLPRIRYLQSALPKLEQENQFKTIDAADSFLGSEGFWAKSIKPNTLVSKADSKELLDPAALNAAGSKIASIQISAKAKTKEAAIIKVERASQFFIDGSAYIDLRDLIRAYELKAISIDSNLKKKISSAEVELDYLQKRIKNLSQLKEQFPAATGMSGQVLDAKDSGAKYLPITTQIIAATTDANNLKESLARYRDEESQNIVYRNFVQKAKPLIDENANSADLVSRLLEIIGQIEKNASGTIQLIAIEEIKIALSAIKTNRIYGLKQAGTVDLESPPYFKFLGVGLFGGLFFGLLIAIGLKIIRQSKNA